MTDAPAPSVSTGVRIGLIAVRLWLLLLVLAGFGQLYFIFQVEPYIDPGVGHMVAIFRMAILSVAIRMLVLAVALYFFTYHHTRTALYGLIAAIFFHAVLCEAIMRIVQAWLTSGPMNVGLLGLLTLPETIVSTIAVAWLLFSREVNALYGVDTREQVAVGVPRLWNRLRGRAATNS